MAIDTHLVSNDFSTSRPHRPELMMNGRYRSCRPAHGDKQVYTLASNGSYCPVGSSDPFAQLSVPLIKYSWTSLRSGFIRIHLATISIFNDDRAAHGAIGFIIVMLFLRHAGHTGIALARIAGTPRDLYLKR
ncbi:hypothetical protein ACNKHL_19820 [Shigella flexneri]